MTIAAVEELLAAACEEWPEVVMDVGAFRRMLEERLGATLTPSLVDGLRLGELYLAAACAHRDARALELFERRFRPAIRHAAARSAPESLVDEVVQQVLTKLFVAEPDRHPAILSFSGQGKLATWLQVVTRREARSRLRWESRHGGAAPTDDEALERLVEHAAQDDAALGDLKDRYREKFREAFRQALEALTPRERNLLRYECLDGLTRDEIGKIYGVSRPTVARWRAACRQALHDETRRLFSEQFRLDQAEFASVIRMIESQLHVSITRLLGDRGEPGTEP